MVATVSSVPTGADRDPAGDTLLGWVERSGSRQTTERRKGGLRFAFYGRVSTEDRQDPETSRVRQQDHVAALVSEHGRIVAEYFDVGQSRVLPWARRPKAAALVAAMADPDRGFDAIVVGSTSGRFTATSSV